MNDFNEIIKKYGLIAVAIVIFIYALFERTEILPEIWSKYNVLGIIFLFLGLIVSIYLSQRLSFSIRKSEEQEMNVQSLFNDSFKLILNNHMEFQSRIEHFFENLLESQMELQQSMTIVKEKLIELDRDFNMNMERIYNKLYDSISRETFTELFLLYVDRIFLRILERFIETLNILENCKNDKQCMLNILNIFKREIRGIIKEMGKSFFSKYKFDIDKRYSSQMLGLLFSFSDDFLENSDFEHCLRVSNWKNCMLKYFIEYTKREIREKVILKMNGGGE